MKALRLLLISCVVTCVLATPAFARDAEEAQKNVTEMTDQLKQDAQDTLEEAGAVLEETDKALKEKADATVEGAGAAAESVKETVSGAVGEVAADIEGATVTDAGDAIEPEEPASAPPQAEEETAGIDAWVNERVGPVSDKALEIVFFTVPVYTKDDGSKIEVPLILIWLVVAAVFMTMFLRFINIRGLCRAFGLLTGKYEADDNEDGQISRFQALSTSLSGTVGLGNIAGVAVAVSIGGPGAVFWMFVYSFFCMSSKFAECALAVKYRHQTPDGGYSGGPMHYLHDGLAQIKIGNGTLKNLGLVLGGLFAVCCIGGSFGGGNMFQANQAYTQLVNVTGGEASFWADKGWLFGLILAFLVGLVIIGGIKSIGNVAGKIVPMMAGVYMVAGLVILAMNYAAIPDAIVKIFSMAFSSEAGLGGVIGALITGVQRANFSNESGLGSAAIAHAAARTDNHISQGLVAMLGPVIDTMFICMMTALVIVVTGVYEGAEGVEGVSLTSSAFESSISWFPYVLAIAVLLFAFSTMISWSYYGLKSATYLFGENVVVETVFKIVFCAMCVVGATVNLGAVINLTDAMIFTMAIPNVIGLYLMSKHLRDDVDAYFSFIKNGETTAKT